MRKENFVTLVMGTIGGILFALGMCMCLVTEWGAFRQGVMVGTVGVAVLLAMVFVRRRMLGKPAVQLDKRTVGIVIFGILGGLVLGVGMCMTMVWQGVMVQGIIVGLTGIVMLLALIPICKGLR